MSSCCNKCFYSFFMKQFKSFHCTFTQSSLRLTSIKSVMPSKHLILRCPLFLLISIFLSIRVFSNEAVLYIICQSIGASASASVLPMKTQDWFPLGWTGLISLGSKGLSRAFSNKKQQKHQFFGSQPSLWSNSTSGHDYWENQSLDYTDLYIVGKVISLIYNMLSRFP